VIIWCVSFSSVEGWTLLLTGRPGDRILGWVRNSAPVQPCLWIHPSTYTLDYVSFPGGKLAEYWHDNPSPPSAEMKERVMLYVGSLSGTSWPVRRKLRVLRKLITCKNVVMWEYCVLITSIWTWQNLLLLTIISVSLCSFEHIFLSYRSYFTLKFLQNFHVGLWELNECHLYFRMNKFF
jgi:hypothetical protein